MFYIVHFWAYDSAVRAFLDPRKFYDYEEAADFAREHDAKVESSYGLPVTEEPEEKLT